MSAHTCRIAIAPFTQTIGDCYVAASGLPKPRRDHHIAMCRFALECLRSMHRLRVKLERTLGPDTADLDMRFGLHSGPGEYALDIHLAFILVMSIHQNSIFNRNFVFHSVRLVTAGVVSSRINL